MNLNGTATAVLRWEAHRIRVYLIWEDKKAPAHPPGVITSGDIAVFLWG